MKAPSKEYLEGWDRIFGKKHNKPRMLTKEELAASLKDLKTTIEIARKIKIKQ